VAIRQLAAAAAADGGITQVTKAGYATFSKRTGVFVQSRWSALAAAKPPYGRLAERLLRWMLR